MNILSDLRRIKKKVSISGMSRAVDKTHLVAPCSRFFALSVHCWILIMVRAPVLTLMELQTWLISMFPFLASEEGFSMWNVVSLDASFVFGCFVLWCSGLVLALHLLYRSKGVATELIPCKSRALRCTSIARSLVVFDRTYGRWFHEFNSASFILII